MPSSTKRRCTRSMARSRKASSRTAISRAPTGCSTDGPFAETREQLGGYYLIEAKDLDEALAIAAKIPSARHGSIEVRPIWLYDGEPSNKA
jgi:hypothetical protein